MKIGVVFLSRVDSSLKIDFIFCLNIWYYYCPMTEDKLRIYIKPTCTTCRNALKILSEKGADFEAINYYEKPFSKKGLTELINKLNISPKDLLRKNEKVYKDLGLSNRDLSDSEIIDLMIKHPDLIQRPIVDGKGKVILARPAEEIKKIL
ncbi:MAG TPA: arsenate reductase family protein [Thermodesulfobacteriota bacterium]